MVASRLSENPNWNVLLLEAGDDPPIESEVKLIHNPEKFKKSVNDSIFLDTGMVNVFIKNQTQLAVLYGFR